MRSPQGADDIQSIRNQDLRGIRGDMAPALRLHLIDEILHPGYRAAEELTVNMLEWTSSLACGATIVNSGGTVSTTVTVAAAVAVLPAASRAVNVTVVGPGGNTAGALPATRSVRRYPTSGAGFPAEAAALSADGPPSAWSKNACTLWRTTFARAESERRLVGANLVIVVALVAGVRRPSCGDCSGATRRARRSPGS